MKITRLSVHDFRAFPLTFDLPLGNGSNLLLHGENGSGKSSLGFALREFLSLESGFPRPIERFVHAFANSPDPTTGAIAPRAPRVEIQFDTAPPEVISWIQGALHPLQLDDKSAPPSTTQAQRERLAGVSRASGFFDYRTLLRSSFRLGTLDLGTQLFRIFIDSLLSGFQPPGGAKTIGDMWNEVVQAKPPTRRIGDMRRARRVTDPFNANLSPFLDRVRVEANRLLGYFPSSRMEITRLSHPGCQYSKPTKSLIGDRLELEITYAGLLVPRHEEFLNEARLTALALSLFLGAVKLADPNPADPAPLRVLLLDDVLIGLDLSHRIPLLNLLHAEFPNHQTFLLTHDRVWFDIAKGYTEHWPNWVANSVYAEIAGADQPELPRLKGNMDDLEVAQRHLDIDDLRAAAVYVRAAFEEHLRKLCKGMPVSYNPNPLEVKADQLWIAILRRHALRLKKSKKRYIDDVLIPKISAMRSAVLNRLAHTGPPSLTKPDVQDALNTVQAFRKMTIPFDPDNAPKTGTSLAATP